MKALVAVLTVLTISSSALADICGIVTQDQGEKSLSLLTKGTKIDVGAHDKMTVQEVTLTYTSTMGNEKYYDLKVNGVQIDPGYVNIRLNKNVSLNLGRLVGCDPTYSNPDYIIPTPMNRK